MESRWSQRARAHPRPTRRSGASAAHVPGPDPALASRRRARRPGLLLAILLIGLCGALPRSASAEEIEGVEFAASARVGDLALRLHGVGLLRYMVLFKAYVAGLYLGPDVSARQVLDDTPKRIEIHYFYGISAADFRWSTEEAIRRNLAADAFEALRPRVDAFNALYRDVVPGDRYALNYLPGVGTELVLNGERLGTIEGAAFGRAVFSIWFGPSEIDASLKQSLLAER